MRLGVALATVMLLLAGCSGDGDGDGQGATTTSTTDGTTSQTTTGTTGTTGATPRPPVADLQVSDVTGTAPLSVNFTVNATDPDGDLASWTLELGDGSQQEGETFPDQVAHTYETDGTFTVALTVVDAGGMTDNATLVLTVTAGELSGITLTAEMDNTCTPCRDVGTDACLERQTELGLINDCAFIEIPAGTAGLPFTLTSTGGDPDLRFRSGDACPGSAGDTFAAAGPEAGTVPEETACAMVWEYASAPSTVTLTIG